MPALRTGDQTRYLAVQRIILLCLRVDFFPLLIIFGLGKNPGHRSLDRIQQIFDVGPGMAFAIGLGTVVGFVIAYYLIGALIFMRVEFDE